MSELFIFLHPVTCGGKTFTDLLARFFWQHEIIVAKNVQDQLYDPYLITPLKRREDRNRALLEEYRHHKERLRLVRGHFHIAYHQRRVWGDRGDIRHLTLLREPVARFISHSHYEFTDMETLRRAEKVPEIDFNLLTTYLSGCETYCATTDDLATAKENLSHYDFVGITEDYDDFIRTFCKRFSFPYLDWTCLNQYRRQKHTIPDDVKARIRELSALDMELYEHGKALFAEQVEKYRQAPLREPTRMEKVLFRLRDIDRHRRRAQRLVRKIVSGHRIVRLEFPDYMIG